ncbi:MAG: head GIN domain-containing protein [Myxococcota bacterium]
MHIFVAVTAFLLASPAAGKSAVRLDGEKFTRISASSAFEIEVRQGSEHTAEIIVDDELKEALIARVRGGTLELGLENRDSFWGRKKSGNKTMRAKVTLPRLTGLDLSGATDVNLIGIDIEGTFDIDASGASDINGELRATEIQVDLSGASDLTLKGYAVRARIDCSGASDVNLFDFTTDTATVSASGASDVEIDVREEIDATASGTADITYSGAATIGRSNASGRAEISKR